MRLAWLVTHMREQVSRHLFTRAVKSFQQEAHLQLYLCLGSFLSLTLVCLQESSRTLLVRAHSPLYLLLERVRLEPPFPVLAMSSTRRGVARARVRITHGDLHICIQNKNIANPFFIQTCFNFDLIFNDFESSAFLLLEVMFHCSLIRSRHQ